jgi:peroxiredoxin
MLTSGDTFPDIALTAVTGEQLLLPRDLNTPYTIVLFYRGHW